jgi:uncharacterized membrane protein YcaP (DUF421 family)
MAHDLFLAGEPLLDKTIRSVVVYLSLVFLLRIAGKREFAQLNNGDLVVLLLLSNTVQNAIIGNDNSLWAGCSARRCWWSPTASSPGSATTGPG